jgi:hypothetical protein
LSAMSIFARTRLPRWVRRLPSRTMIGGEREGENDLGELLQTLGCRDHVGPRGIGGGSGGFHSELVEYMIER